MKVKVIFIDVVNRQVKEIEIENTLEAFYKQINCRVIECPVSLLNRDAIFVDEEGYLKDQVGGFTLDRFVYPLSGNAIIAGTDEEGEIINAKTSVKEIEEQIQFYLIPTMERFRAYFQKNGFTVMTML